MAGQRKDGALVNSIGSKQPKPPSAPNKPSWVARRIDAVQGHLKKRRAQRAKESAADHAARSMARATWAIAGLTVAAIAVGVSQYIIFNRQLVEMRRAREAGDEATATQMDALRTQAKIMQGQLDQMTMAQRPWLLIDNLSVSSILQFPAGAGIVAFGNYRLTNIGHSPATAIFIRTALLFRDVDELSADTVPRLCQPQPAEKDQLLVRYSDTVLPGQNQTIDGIGDGPTFKHSIEGLIARRDARREADNAFLKQHDFDVPPLHSGDTRLNAELTVAGCVSYKVAGIEALHRTGFAFDIYNGIVGIFIDVGQKGEIYTGPPLDITPSAMSNFAD